MSSSVRKYKHHFLFVYHFTTDEAGFIYIPSQENICKFNESNYSIAVEHRVKIDGVVKRDNDLIFCVSQENKIYRFDLVSNQLLLLAGTGRHQTEDGPFKEACFEAPYCITLDRNGNLYVGDDYCVRKLDMNKKIVSTVAGSTKGYENGECKDAKFDVIGDILVLDDNTIFVADRFNHCIRQISHGLVSTIAGCPKDEEIPQKLAWNHFGYQLIILDMLSSKNTKRIRVLDLKTRKVEVITMSAMVVGNDKKGNIVLLTDSEIILVDNPWKYIRYLWIGHKKEDPEICPLARLPRELVKEISSLVSRFEL